MSDLSATRILTEFEEGERDGWLSLRQWTMRYIVVELHYWCPWFECDPSFDFFISVVHQNLFFGHSNQQEAMNTCRISGTKTYSMHCCCYSVNSWESEWIMKIVVSPCSTVGSSFLSNTRLKSKNILSYRNISKNMRFSGWRRRRYPREAIRIIYVLNWQFLYESLRMLVKWFKAVVEIGTSH